MNGERFLLEYLKKDNVILRANKDKSELLELINQSLPQETLAKFKELDQKRQDETLSEAEHQTLIQLTTEMEAYNVGRIKHLSELALLRKTDLRSIMNELGITPEIA